MNDSEYAKVMYNENQTLRRAVEDLTLKNVDLEKRLNSAGLSSAYVYFGYYLPDSEGPTMAHSSRLYHGQPCQGAIPVYVRADDSDKWQGRHMPIVAIDEMTRTNFGPDMRMNHGRRVTDNPRITNAELLKFGNEVETLDGTLKGSVEGVEFDIGASGRTVCVVKLKVTQVGEKASACTRVGNYAWLNAEAIKGYQS